MQLWCVCGDPSSWMSSHALRCTKKNKINQVWTKFEQIVNKIDMMIIPTPPNFKPLLYPLLDPSSYSSLNKYIFVWYHSAGVMCWFQNMCTLMMMSSMECNHVMSKNTHLQWMNGCAHQEDSMHNTNKIKQNENQNEYYYTPLGLLNDYYIFNIWYWTYFRWI